MDMESCSFRISSSLYLKSARANRKMTCGEHGDVRQQRGPRLRAARAVAPRALPQRHTEGPLRPAGHSATRHAASGPTFGPS